MKKFQIVLSTLDYGQTKIRNVKKNTFAEALPILHNNNTKFHRELLFVVLFFYFNKKIPKGTKCTHDIIMAKIVPTRHKLSMSQHTF